MKKLISFAVLGLASLSLGGCAIQHGEDGAGDPGQGDQAFSANWNYSWGDTKQSSADIGTSVGRTCFLTGIGGNFRPGGTIWDPPGSWNPASGGVRINAQGHYEIFVNPNPGQSIIVQARCVNGATNRVFGTWTGGADTVLGATSTKRQCFLTSINNAAVNSTYTSNWAFTNTTDFVQVHHDRYRWYVGGAIANGWVSASAVCIDDFTAEGSYGVGLAPSAGSNTVPMTNVAGSTCGLTKVQGSLQAAFGDWNDELVIAASGAQFSLTSHNGKAGAATCMQ